MSFSRYSIVITTIFILIINYPLYVNGTKDYVLQGSSSTLSGGQIAGIVIGFIALCCLLGCIGAACKGKENVKPQTTPTPPPEYALAVVRIP
ncbi:unnamed protein product [Adineta ricciae]|uniref:Uncharacterized protein n=1 Tax=Adineta ricciae TaxID=249248 RepID=A0A814BBK1_ADIRI|nr:unnamed protein product [Adineta ricciae]CAF1077386.1 unnamed protein product [Adineta ricciae]